MAAAGWAGRLFPCARRGGRRPAARRSASAGRASFRRVSRGGSEFAARVPPCSHRVAFLACPLTPKSFSSTLAEAFAIIRVISSKSNEGGTDEECLGRHCHGGSCCGDGVRGKG